MSGGQLRVGIVGSRRRNSLKDRRIVFNLIDRLMKENPDREITIVSGGCKKGADAFAKEAALKIWPDRLKYKEHPVPEKEYAHKGEWVVAAFGRNRDIAVDSDVVYALCSSDRTGGTENTVGHCEDLKRRTFLVDDDGAEILIVG